METLLKLMMDRRSVRSYTDEPVPEEKLEMILQAGLLAPSGRNTRPWEFVVVRDRETLRRMAECRVGAAKMLSGAACAIVVLGDEGKTDTVIEDCSIALAQMHLMAASLGLGSCWIQGRLRQAPDGRTTEDYLRELLGFPASMRLEAILSVGVPAQTPPPHEAPDIHGGKVHWEKF